MSYIIFIFIIIVFHICVDYCKAQAARLEASDLAKNSALIATAPNNIGCGTISIVLRIQITMCMCDLHDTGRDGNFRNRRSSL